MRSPGPTLLRVLVTLLAVVAAIRMSWLLVALACLVGIILLYIGSNILVGVTQWPEPDAAWRPPLVDVGVLGFLVVLAMSGLHQGSIDPRRVGRRLVASAVVVAAGLFLAAAVEALSGTTLAFATILSTHRALIRSVERLLEQILLPGTA